jgi:tripartite-type tricarboxylate transporter receptor subunit TctC
MQRRAWMRAALGTGTLALLGRGASAQPAAYPNRPVRVIVPFAAGGSGDIIGRVVTTRLSEALGQPFIVENRAGAGGTIGTRAVATAAPDGYTLLLATPATAVNASLYRSLPYDTLRDLMPVVVYASTPYFIIANARLEASTIPELIDLARARPGIVNYGSAGVGSATHLAGELFGRSTGTVLTHVPYRGTNPAVTDLIRGDVQLMFVGLPATAAHIQAGQLKALAVADSARSPFMPEVPTVEEGGVPGFQVGAWFAVMAPAGTPTAMADRIAVAVNEIVATPDARRILADAGTTPIRQSRAEFAAFFQAEVARWARVIRDGEIPQQD